MNSVGQEICGASVVKYRFNNTNSKPKFALWILKTFKMAHGRCTRRKKKVGNHCAVSLSSKQLLWASASLEGRLCFESDNREKGEGVNSKDRESRAHRPGNPQFSADRVDVKWSALEEGLLQEPSVGSKLGHSDIACESADWVMRAPLNDSTVEITRNREIRVSHWLGPDLMIYMGYLVCIWAARQGNVFAVSSEARRRDGCGGHAPLPLTGTVGANLFGLLSVSQATLSHLSHVWSENWFHHAARIWPSHLLTCGPICIYSDIRHDWYIVCCYIEFRSETSDLN